RTSRSWPADSRSLPLWSCLASGDRAAGRFDRRLGAGGGEDAAAQRDLDRQLAALDDLDVLGHLADQLGLLQGQHVDLGRAEALEFAERDLGVVLGRLRLEAALGQATLQRHLAAFEADLVVAARARLLALVAAARG